MGTRRRKFAIVATAIALIAATVPVAAHEDGVTDADASQLNGPSQQVVSEREAHHLSTNSEIVSSGPSAKVTKNLSVVGRGERNDSGVTTDVWAHDGYAYTGTFSTLCSTGDNDSGIWVWDVSNPKKVRDVGVIDSPAGSKANDVRVDTMNSGDILVLSNESCGGGPGGFEIYDVNDPESPEFIAHVQTDDVNDLLRDGLGFTDFGVHNLFLFTQGSNDYVAVTVESEFGNFQIFDITDPSNPALVGFWGAEQLFRPDITDWSAFDVFGEILEIDAYLFDGFGASQNRFLHDATITADGNTAYLASWDAGLVTLDISDVTNPTVVSVAIDPSSEDGEVNSHAVWPSEDGSVVIEGEEDFSPGATVFSITSGSDAGDYPAAEGAITVPISSLPGETMSGSTTYVGLACNDDPLPAGSGIALIQRGACAFTDKVNNAEAAGYKGVVVFNDAARGDALVTMGGTDTDLPGVFVGHFSGLKIAGVAFTADLVVGAPGESVSVGSVFDGWSGFRIWDFTDPANPVLASTFNTTCSATVDPSCVEGGTYSAHNVIVPGWSLLSAAEPFGDGMQPLGILSGELRPVVPTWRLPYDPRSGRHPNQIRLARRSSLGMGGPDLGNQCHVGRRPLPTPR